MSVARLARRYSKSILDLAVEQEEEDQVFKDMKFILDTCEESRDLVVLLKSPIVPEEKKGTILEKVFKGQVSKITFQFIKIVVRKGREPYLQAIASDYIDQYYEHKDILKVTLVTAVKVSEKIQNNIIGLIEQEYDKTVNLTTEIDKSVIGGFILRFEDYLYDASIANQLKSVEDKLVSANV